MAVNKEKLEAFERRLSLLLILLLVKFVNLFLVLFSPDYHFATVSAVHLEVPQMSGDEYVALFATQDAEASAKVAQLLTGFGLREEVRPPFELVYDDYYYTTNMSFDGLDMKHERRNESFCSVLLTAGLEPGMKRDVLRVWNEFVGNRTLLALSSCDKPALLGLIGDYYSATVFNWVYDMALFFVFFFGCMFSLSDECFALLSFCYYWGSAVLYSVCTAALFVGAYRRYIANAAAFLQSQTTLFRASPALAQWPYRVVRLQDPGASVARTLRFVAPALVCPALYVGALLLIALFGVPALCKVPQFPWSLRGFWQHHGKGRDVELAGYGEALRPLARSSSADLPKTSRGLLESEDLK